MTIQSTNLQFDYARYGFRNEENYLFKAPVGLSEWVVRELSGMKGELFRGGVQARSRERLSGQRPISASGSGATR